MRFKDDKRRVELTDLQVRQLIEYLMEARNRFLDKGLPTDDVSNLLCAVMKLQKKHKVSIRCHG